MKSKNKNKLNIRPKNENCNTCKFHELCLPETGHIDYQCPKVKHPNNDLVKEM